jgi:hypothetical protein
MIAIKGHFDGRVIVPDEPVDLPRDQTFTIRIDTSPTESPAPSSRKAALMSLAGTMTPEEGRAMMEAIDEHCGRVEKDGW